MSAAHTLYASYASVVANEEATTDDMRTMVTSIKENSRCECLPCKVVTTMYVTSDIPDEYLISMCKEMSNADAWNMRPAMSRCPFGADRRWEIEEVAAITIQKYARRLIVYQTVEFPVDPVIEKEYAITPEMCA